MTFLKLARLTKHIEIQEVEAKTHVYKKRYAKFEAGKQGSLRQEEIERVAKFLDVIPSLMQAEVKATKDGFTVIKPQQAGKSEVKRPHTQSGTVREEGPSPL